MSVRRIAEADLHAYVDGWLPVERRQEVEAWLAEHPGEAARLAAYVRINDALRGRYQEVMEEAVPARLLPRRRGRYRAPVAAVAALLAGLVVGWLARGVSEGDGGVPLPRRAALAHAVYAPEVRHPVEVSAEQEAHLVTWLSNRLGAPLRPPRLEAASFALVGGRLLPDREDMAAQFMYEDEAGRRLTLFVTRAAPVQGAAFRFAREGGIGVFYWVDAPFGYALAGTLEREELLAVARLVYAGLSAASDSASEVGVDSGALQRVPRQTQAVSSPR